MANGNFLAPISDQVLSLLRADSHSPALIPAMCFRPVGVRNKLAKVLNANKVFVSVDLEAAYGRDQSHAVSRASGVQVAPNDGEIVASIRARSSTCMSAHVPQWFSGGNEKRYVRGKRLSSGHF